MRFKTIVLLFIASVLVFSVQGSDSISLNGKGAIIENQNKLENIKDYRHSGEVTIKSNKKTFIEYALPSIIALIVGLMPFIATLIASKKQRLTAEKQIEASKETIKEQIESSLKIAEMDFRKNVLSDNRQKWINDLRNVISELLSLYNSSILDLKNMQLKDYERILFLITKAEFMLNPEKDVKFINSIKELKDSLISLFRKEIERSSVEEKIEIVKIQTKATLKTEWERVKRGE